MNWEIMILTMPSRKPFLSQLLSLLEPQCSGHDVGIRVCPFKNRFQLGENREFYRKQCTATHHNWIDDDDLVAPDYVSRISPLLSGVDYIGYKVQMFINAVKGPTAIHSLRYKGWNTPAVWDNKNAILERDISHLNPIRTDLALQFPMDGDRGEDGRWATGMTKMGIVKTQKFIDDVMYYYLWRKPKCRDDKNDYGNPLRLQMLRQLVDDAKQLRKRAANSASVPQMASSA